MNLEERRMDERESFAIKNMKLLWLSNDVIENFKNGKISFFGITGYPEELYKDSYCYKQVSLFESKYNSKVYAVIYSDLGFGACYSFLYIPGYKEDWQYLLMPGEDFVGFIVKLTYEIGHSRNYRTSVILRFMHPVNN